MTTGLAIQQSDSAASLAPLRSEGRLRLAFRRSGSRTILADSFQSGCLRVRLPRQTAGEAEAILINTAGGLAEGDRLEQDVTWRPGASFAVTSQAAERVYKAMDHGASISTRLAIEAGASAAWMPQETILFDQARLTRRIDIEMAADARFLAMEAVILGRVAMGERMTGGRIVDRWRIRRAGRIVYADALALETSPQGGLARRALGDGAGAFATLLLVAPDAGERLDRVRAVLAQARGRAAASHWNGILAVRLLAARGSEMRHDLTLALDVMRDGCPLPRVWSC